MLGLLYPQRVAQIDIEQVHLPIDTAHVPCRINRQARVERFPAGADLRKAAANDPGL